MKKVKYELNFQDINIMEFNHKAVLENYIDSRHFIQRKNYSEWYLDIESILIEIDISDLQILSSTFNVSVYEKAICLAEK